MLVSLGKQHFEQSSGKISFVAKSVTWLKTYNKLFATLLDCQRFRRSLVDDLLMNVYLICQLSPANLVREQRGLRFLLFGNRSRLDEHFNMKTSDALIFVS